jgi:vacuolar protein sorting-associated protein 13A/C
MENAAGSFYAHASVISPSSPLIRDLSETLLRTVSHMVTDMERPEITADSAPNQGSLRRLPSASSRIDSMASGRHTAGRYLIITPEFERMWWDKGSEFRPAASIWRPVVPAGYAIVGDCLLRGYATFSFMCVFIFSTKTAWMSSSDCVRRLFNFLE